MSSTRHNSKTRPRSLAGATTRRQNFHVEQRESRDSRGEHLTARFRGRLTPLATSVARPRLLNRVYAIQDRVSPRRWEARSVWRRQGTRSFPLRYTFTFSQGGGEPPSPCFPFPPPRLPPPPPPVGRLPPAPPVEIHRVLTTQSLRRLA